MENHNIVLAGVGGQGVLLLAEILGNAAILDNYDVRVSEIHGMAQRGGTVLCDVRMGEKVYSPTTPDGSADFLVGLEPVETLRHTKLINSETIIIVNKHIVPPASVLTGQNKYPSFDDITNILQKFTKNTIFIDAYELAKKAGNVNVQNIVLLGVLSSFEAFPLKKNTLKKSIIEIVSPKFMKVNIQAFNIGLKYQTLND